MEINNSEFLSVFQKLEENNKIRIVFDRKIYGLSRNLYTKIVERFIFNDKNGGRNIPYEMITRLNIWNPKDTNPRFRRKFLIKK